MKLVELQNEEGETVSDDFRFDPVDAGKEVIKSIYMANLTNKTVQDIKFSVDGENVEVVESPDRIRSDERQEIKLRLSPSENKISPIRADINYSGKVVAE